jgi:hypothetical protein
MAQSESGTQQKADTPAPASADSEFSQLASQSQTGLVREFVDFLLHNKSWWLTPIILVLLLIGVLAFLSSGSAVAPFIYTVF